MNAAKVSSRINQKLSRNFLIFLFTIALSTRSDCQDSCEAVFARFKERLAQADGGDPNAAYDVGSALESGVTGPRDFERALHYFKKSGELGNPFAWFDYGLLLQRVNPNDRSDHYLNLATTEVVRLASEGHGFSQEQIFNLGEFFWSGSGSIQEDKHEALVWWSKGMDRGDDNCSYKVAVAEILSISRHSTRDSGLSALCKLSAKGHPLAIYTLHAFVAGRPEELAADISFSDEELERAWEGVERGIDDVFSEGYYDDGKRTYFGGALLWSGIGVEKNRSDAITLWTRSTELGNFFAADVLICVYLGLLGKQHENRDLALEYLEFRASFGDLASIELLDSINTKNPFNAALLAPFEKTLDSLILEGR